jgi:hypothetical protein
MDIWRAIQKKAEDPDDAWKPINNKIYVERRFATSSMKYGNYKMSYDEKEDMWVSADGRWVFRVVKATVKDEDWENVPPK